MNRTASQPDELYFVTLTIVGWVDVFTRLDYCDFIINNLAFCQKSKGLEVYEYVLMTNHIHMIASGNQVPLSDILRDFKSFTSKELYKLIKNNPEESRKDWMLPIFDKAGKQNPMNEKHQLWQNMNSPILIYNQEIYDQKTEYIYNNPVKAGIVTDPEYYYYCSACAENPLVLAEY